MGDDDHRPTAPRRTISEVLRGVREREDQDGMLDDEETAHEEDSCLGPLVRSHTNPHASLPVYKTIHRYSLSTVAERGVLLMALQNSAIDNSEHWSVERGEVLRD